MIYGVEPAAIVIFVGFVLLVLGISFYLGRRVHTASGYFAAEGKIHWAVNGVAFAGEMPGTLGSFRNPADWGCSSAVSGALRTLSSTTG